LIAKLNTLDAKRVANDIKNFKVQGANQIALYSLEFLKQYVIKNGFDSKFFQIINILENARPTAVVLHNCIESIRKNKTLTNINDLISLLNISHKKNIDAKLIIQNKSTIMTYCHSGETMSLIKELAKQKKISVYACITEPLEQGLRTVKDLKKSKIAVTLIGDNAAGLFMKDTDMVIVGADALRKEGVVNKIGTSLLAFAAHQNKKPFYVVANSWKIDKRKFFEIEERSPTEINKKLTYRIKDTVIRNPAFDITPWKFISHVVMENGVFCPSHVLRKLK
jgi:ribose 1,5-bisphosphate isomerase